MSTQDPVKPSPSLITKVASLLVLYEEHVTSDGMTYDRKLASLLRRDLEVVEWLRGMEERGILPVPVNLWAGRSLAYKAGYNRGLHGPDMINCDSEHFTTEQSTRDWHDGKEDGKKDREKI